MEEKIYIGKEAIATRLNASVYLVTKWIKYHNLPAFQFKNGGKLEITEGAINKWLKKYQENRGKVAKNI